MADNIAFTYKGSLNTASGVLMKHTLFAAALRLALTACSPVSPRAPQTASAQTQTQSAAERNKANALAFYELAFNQHDLNRAVRQYVGKEYLQHNPMVADGGQAFIDTFAPFLKQNPQSRASVKRVIAEGDLVALHVHSQLSPEDKGEAVVDIFRFDNDLSIYLHDTSSKDVFARENRGVSHGCVRVQYPYELAAFLIGNDNTKMLSRIRYSMVADVSSLGRGRERLSSERLASADTLKRSMLIGSVNVTPKVPVHIVYYTLYPDHEGRLIRFSDVYGYDVLVYNYLRNYL